MVDEKRFFNDKKAMISILSNMANEIVYYLGSNKYYEFGDLKIQRYSHFLDINLGETLVLHSSYGEANRPNLYIFMDGDWKDVILMLYNNMSSLVNSAKKFECGSMSDRERAYDVLDTSLHNMLECYNGDEFSIGKPTNTNDFAQYLNESLNKYDIFVTTQLTTRNFDGTTKVISLYIFHYKGEIVGSYCWDIPWNTSRLAKHEFTWSIHNTNWLIPIRTTTYEKLEARVIENQRKIDKESSVLIKKLTKSKLVKRI